MCNLALASPKRLEGTVIDCSSFYSPKNEWVHMFRLDEADLVGDIESVNFWRQPDVGLFLTVGSVAERSG